MSRLPQQDNRAVSHKMAASVIYNNLLELARNSEQEGTGDRSQCQLDGVLSPHVERLLAPLNALQQGTGGGRRTGKRRQTMLCDTARTGSGSKGITSPSSGTT